MNRFASWLMGGLAGIATFLLLPYAFVLLILGLNEAVPLSTDVQEKSSLVAILLSLGGGITVSIWVTRRLRRVARRPLPTSGEVEFACDRCSATVAAPASLAEGNVTCGSCGQTLRVPLTATARYSPSRGYLAAASLFVIVILGLGTIWASSIRRVLAERENQSRTAVNMMLIVRALHKYHDDHGQYPPAIVRDAEGRPLYSWRVLLLPYLGREDLARKFNQREPWNSAHNKALLREMPEVYRSGFEAPDNSPHCTSFLLMSGDGTLFAVNSLRRSSDVHDGASNTICLVEVLASQVAWTEPVDMDLPSLARSGLSRDGLPIALNSWQRIEQIAMFDGRVLAPAADMSPEAWLKACVPNDSLRAESP